MELEKSYYDGKELYYGYPCGYRCYFHKNFVRKGLERMDDDCYGEDYYTVYKVDFPIINCDIIVVDDNLVVIPGNYNLFGFHCDGKIIEIDHSINVISSNEKNCALILSGQDKVKIKWTDSKNRKWITVLHTDRFRLREEIASEELLKYL